MAEKTTFGVKMDSERKEELQRKIAESNMTAEEYVLMAFESLEQGRNKSTVAGDIEIRQVDEHLNRISEMFVALCKSRKDAIDTHDETIAFYKNVVEQQKAQILDAKTQAEETITEIRAAADEKMKKAEEEVKVLNKLLEDTKKELIGSLNQSKTQTDLIIEYKEKNDTLNGIITKNQLSIKEAEETKANFESLKRQHQSDIDNLIGERSKLSNDLQSQISSLQKALLDAESTAKMVAEKNEVELERNANRMQAEFNSQILKMQAEFNAQLQAEREQIAMFIQQLKPANSKK